MAELLHTPEADDALAEEIICNGSAVAKGFASVDGSEARSLGNIQNTIGGHAPQGPAKVQGVKKFELIHESLVVHSFRSHLG